MTTSIIFGVIITILFLMGCHLNICVICYLARKPSACKTAFDLVLIDTIISTLLYSFTLYCGDILYIGFSAQVSHDVIVTFTIIQYIAIHLFFASWFVTMCVKYLYLFHGYLMLECSDSMIRETVLFFRIFLVIIYIILDFNGPFSNTPSIFYLLASQHSRYSFLV